MGGDDTAHVEPDDRRLEVGRIDKPHGLQGEVVVTLTSDRADRLAAGSRLFTASHGEQTMDVVAARPHQERWLVTFEGVAAREAAETLRGTSLWAPVAEHAADEMWAYEVVGAQVVTVEGRRCGPVAAVLTNPASDLLELEDGTLVPATFVVDSSQLPAELVIDPPDGLFDL